MIRRFSNNLSSISNTKYKIIPSYLNKFINHLMVDGKKGIAVEIFAHSLRLFSRKLQEGREAPLLIKNQHESYSKNQTFLLDGRYRAPAFALKPIWRSPGVNPLGLAFYPPLCLSLLTKDQYKNCSPLMSTGTDRVRQKVPERTILPGKKHHYRESNASSPSLISCLEQAVINVEPSLEVRKKKIAGITRQIPSTLSKSRGQGLAIRWIVESARGRRRKEGKRFSECLAEELVSAYHKKGEPRQKRDALHKLAESNRSFLRYRWW